MVAGLATLCVGVLAAGGASRFTVVSLALLAAFTASTQLRSRRRLESFSPLLGVIGVAIALTTLQLVPVPPGVATALSPEIQELVTDGRALLDVDPDGWRPLSGDPATSRTELVKLFAYLLIAWMALRAAASERGRQYLLTGVAGIAGIVAVVAVIHELLGADTLFGVYSPEHARPLVMAPLLNPNHLACLMVLGAITAGGLALHERRAPPVRVLWILVAGGCIAVALATRSRGGILGLSAGVTVTCVIVVLQGLKARRSTDRRDVLRVLLPGVVILLCSLILAVYLGGSGVRDELESTRLSELSDPASKYGAWRSALTLVNEAPVLGIGRGAFESAFTRVHDVSGQVTFSHVENEYLQVVVDWGVAGALALGAALLFALVVAVRRWRRGPLAATALGGLAAVGVHSVVDFGLELPGLAIPVVLVASTLLYVPLVEGSRSGRRFALRSSWIALTVLVAGFAALPSGTSLAEDHAELARERATVTDARAALRRHPLDYVAAAHVARTAETARERVAFLNHAMRLHPTHPGLHRAAAVWLANSGRPTQAALEFRLAVRGTGTPESLLREIVTYFPTPEAAANALPADHPHWHRIVAAFIDMKRDDFALAYLLAVVELHPRAPREQWQRVLTLAERGRRFDVAERAASTLLELERTPAARNQLARIQVLAKKLDDAKRTLAPLLDAQIVGAEHVEARLMVCDIHIELREWQTARSCLAILLQAPTPMAMRRKIHGRLARVEQELGNHDRAAFERKLAGSGN
jgi:O-antigen ligase